MHNDIFAIFYCFLDIYLNFLAFLKEFYCFSQEVEKSGKCGRKFEMNGEIDYVNGFILATIKQNGGSIYESRFIETQSGGI